MTLAPRTGLHALRDVCLHDGTLLPVLALACTTLGSAASWLTPAWAGRMFGPGQPLDAARHHLILPDALGSGRSAKPSDGPGAGLPGLHLWRHGGRAAPPADRGAGHPAPAGGHRLLDGRHAHPAAGRPAAGLDGHRRADGGPARAHGRAQLAAAPHAVREHPPRPRLARRALHPPAARAGLGLHLLRAGRQRRRAGPAGPGARRGRGRRAAGPAPRLA